MKDILIALDSSGSASYKGLRNELMKCLKTQCLDANIKIASFDFRRMTYHSASEILNSDTSIRLDWYHGGGSTLDKVNEVKDDYDKVIVITDGYIPHDSNLEGIELVVYEETYWS